MLWHVWQWEVWDRWLQYASICRTKKLRLYLAENYRGRSVMHMWRAQASQQRRWAIILSSKQSALRHQGLHQAWREWDNFVHRQRMCKVAFSKGACPWSSTFKSNGNELVVMLLNQSSSFITIGASYFRASRIHVRTSVYKRIGCGLFGCICCTGSFVRRKQNAVFLRGWYDTAQRQKYTRMAILQYLERKSRQKV